MRLLLRRGDNDGHRVAQFHHIIHQHFDIVGAGGFELDLTETNDIGGMKAGVLQRELALDFAQHSRLVRGDEPNCFRELAHTSRPAIEQGQFERHHGQLGDADQVDHADEDEVTGDFLANLFAQ